MWHLKDISLGYKIPLHAALLIVLTAAVLASVLAYRSIGDLRDSMIASADGIGSVVANTLADPLRHDDPWRAYEIITTPFHAAPDEPAKLGMEYILVLDAENKVFASSHPRRFPLLSEPAADEPDLSPWLKNVRNLKATKLITLDAPHSNAFYLLTPIQTDGVRFGTLVMSYSRKPFEQRFYSLVSAAVMITTLVLGPFVALAAFWGRRMASPLIKLSETMSQVAPGLPEPSELLIEESRDEIGHLAGSFKAMLTELKEKELLQQQIVASDRLAAVGRLAAGVAHEINNPLGGMLNAISTYRRHGEQNPLTLKTLSTLERGLLQIKEIVAALLVEVRVQTRPFDLNDVADVCTLIQSDVDKKQARFTREIDIAGSVPVSSTLVRQVCINLLLNAVNATQPRGRVHLHVHRDGGHLFVDVLNDGSTIPQEKIPYLFEPFTSFSENGIGLGLWVVYQVVQQLGGLITVKSEADETRFIVQLPVQEGYE